MDLSAQVSRETCSKLVSKHYEAPAPNVKSNVGARDRPPNRIVCTAAAPISQVFPWYWRPLL